MTLGNISTYTKDLHNYTISHYYITVLKVHMNLANKKKQVLAENLAYIFDIG